MKVSSCPKGVTFSAESGWNSRLSRPCILEMAGSYTDSLSKKPMRLLVWIDCVCLLVSLAGFRWTNRRG